MLKSLFYKSTFKTYLIPILLLVFSFAIYSYNLELQSVLGDEIVYLSWGGPYFDLVVQGDFDNPCLKGLKDCELLYDPDWKGHNINYSPIRNFLTGLGFYLTTGEVKGDWYEWSCVWYDCWDAEKYPSNEVFASSRFFSPIFGSLSVVIAFFIGKILFNRTTGLFFSLILLFHSLWIAHSRVLMSEVYLYFFILLSVLFLLKSFKKQNNLSLVYFILGSISFGLAFNIKLIAFEFIIPIAVIIIFYDSFNERLNFKFFKNIKNIAKSITLLFMFFMIAFITFVATSPKYYEDTLDNIMQLREDSEIGWASFPTTEKNYLFHTLMTLQVTLVPYLMDSYVYEEFPSEVLNSRLRYDWVLDPTGSIFNYSTIPLSLFFFIGLIYMVKKIITRNIIFSEFVLLVLITSLFIFSVLVIDDPTIERYYLPLMFPIMLIASYVLAKFINKIQNQREKILFFMSFIIAHTLYIIPWVKEMYMEPIWWINPIPMSSQEALNDPLVYVSTIAFIMISFLIYFKSKKVVPTK